MVSVLRQDVTLQILWKMHFSQARESSIGYNPDQILTVRLNIVILISAGSSSNGSIIAVGAEGSLRGISGSGCEYPNGSWTPTGVDLNGETSHNLLGLMQLSEDEMIPTLSC